MRHTSKDQHTTAPKTRTHHAETKDLASVHQSHLHHEEEEKKEKEREGANRKRETGNTGNQKWGAQDRSSEVNGERQRLDSDGES